MRDPVANAWQIHSAIMDWTGKADTKAGLILTADAALVGSIIAISKEGSLFGGVSEGPLVLKITYYAALILIGFSGYIAIVAILPSLRKSKLKKEAAGNYIYFGHLKYWEPEALRYNLQTKDILYSLSKQITVASKIAWSKHRLTVWATSFAALGLAALGLAIAAVMACDSKEDQSEDDNRALAYSVSCTPCASAAAFILS